MLNVLNKEKIKLYLVYPLCILACVLFIHSREYTFDFSISVDQYLSSAWLFNYDYGFMQRGLVGEILQQFGIDKSYDNIRIISLIIFITLFYSLYLLLTSTLSNKLHLDQKNTLIYTAYFLFLSFVTSQYILELGRFDQIFQILTLFFLFLIIKNTNQVITTLYIISIIPLITLIHEAGIIIFIPTILTIYFLEYRSKNSLIFFIILSVISIILISKFGKISVDHAQIMIDKYKNIRGYNEFAFRTTTLNMTENLVMNWNSIINKKIYIPFILCIIIISPILYFIIKSIDQKKYLFAFIFAASPLSLCLIAFDFFRWICLFLFNCFIIFTYLINKNLIDINQILQNLVKYKNKIFIYSILSLFIGPLGVVNLYPHFYKTNEGGLSESGLPNNIVNKITDPILLANIKLTLSDEYLIAQLPFINSNTLDKKIIKNYTVLANSGDGNMQNIVGFMNFYGLHTPFNHCKALAMFARSSQSKDPNGLNNLSELYRHGICIDKNLKKANALLIMASYYGNTTSKLKLANNYLEGTNGFPQDKKEAIKLLTELKESGNLPAEILLESLQSNHVQKST